jgi:hypothetical protein
MAKTAIAPGDLAALLREERELLADQRRIAGELNAYSQRMSYAVDHTKDGIYVSLLEQSRRNTTRLDLIRATLDGAA